jgi:diacylglycerol kinase family enzyme
MDPLPVLMNARAGLARPAGEVALARALAGEAVKAVIEEVAPGRLADRLERLRGRPMVGVAGGDGTQRTAARVLTGSGTVLVPFPTGRLNHFARRLGLDTLKAAAAAARRGVVRTLPVGRANGRVFINTAVTGAYPRFVRVRERLRPFLTSWPAAGAATLHGLALWPRVRLVVRSPATALECHTAMLWVGVGSGSYPAPHEAPVPRGDDALEVVILRGGGRRLALPLLTATALHRLGHPRALERTAHLQLVPWIHLEADRPIPIALDGEPRLLHPPVTLRYEADALRVIAPAEA